MTNAVAAFYASQPPPPERTKPYFESMLFRPLFIRLFRLAIGKLKADISEEETDFIAVTTILNSASLLNEYRDLLAEVGENDIEDPAFYDTLRERTQDLEARRRDGVVTKKIKELLNYADDYRNTYKDGSGCSVKKRGLLIEEMKSAIELVDQSLDVDS